MKKTSPFDFMNSIYNGDNEVSSGNFDIKDYNAFIINRGLSMNIDTVLLAQEMNIRPLIPNENQYHFLHILTKKKKRWGKWFKKSSDKNDFPLIEILSKEYKFSSKRIDEILNLLNDDQKLEIIKDFDKGQKLKN